MWVCLHVCVYSFQCQCISLTDISLSVQLVFFFSQWRFSRSPILLCCSIGEDIAAQLNHTVTASWEWRLTQPSLLYPITAHVLFCVALSASGGGETTTAPCWAVRWTAVDQPADCMCDWITAIVTDTKQNTCKWFKDTHTHKKHILKSSNGSVYNW